MTEPDTMWTVSFSDRDNRLIEQSTLQSTEALQTSLGPPIPIGPLQSDELFCFALISPHHRYAIVFTSNDDAQPERAGVLHLQPDGEWLPQGLQLSEEAVFDIEQL